MQGLRNLVRLLKLTYPYRWSIALGLCCLLFATPASLFHPLVWRFIVDEVILNHRHHLLIPALVVMVVVQLIGVALSSLRTYVLGRAGQRFVYDLRQALYEKLQSQSLLYHHDRRVGDTVARVIADVDTVQDAIRHGIDDVIANALQFLWVAGIIVAINPTVGTLTLLPMGIVALMVWFFNIRIRGLYRRIRDRLGDLSAKLQENLVGMIVIKAFARELHELSRFAQENKRYYDESLKGELARSLYFPSVATVGFFSSVIMVGVGAYFIILGQFSVGDLVAYRGYWWQLFSPVSAMARVNELVQRCLAAASRIFEVLDAPVEVADQPSAIPLKDADGHIVFEKVSFRYREGPWVLRDISFEVHPGQKVGIVGPSGAGKSTVLGLILRFFDPVEGRILVDGYDLREVVQSDWRRHCAIVTQEPFL
ncbi:MAG: ABC transporter ATP-binding protein/permease, partial [Armatimonadetes bacterium]|nr:ABC transporter ATP-binding protein/permease [Armatimonadota bacterium]